MKLEGTTVLPVDIIGINEPNITQNSAMFAGKPVSWIRDHLTAVSGPSPTSITSAWGAAHRDVIILDPLNGKIEAYNLNTYPLTIAANRTTMKNKLIAAATPADTDGDKLPDYWEQWAYGSLSGNAATTGADGYQRLLHYAHCNTAPGAGVIPGLPQIVALPGVDGGSISVLWTRRRGTAFGLSLTPEFSSTLSAWTGSAHGYEDWSSRTLYDGSGGELIEWRSAVSNPMRFSRVRVVLP